MYCFLCTASCVQSAPRSRLSHRKSGTVMRHQDVDHANLLFSAPAAPSATLGSRQAEVKCSGRCAWLARRPRSYNASIIRQPPRCSSCWASASVSVLRYHGCRLTTRALFACCPGGCRGGSPACGLRVRGAWPCRFGAWPFWLHRPRNAQLLRALRLRGPLVVTVGHHALTLVGYSRGAWILLDSATGFTRRTFNLRASFAFGASFAHNGCA